MNANSPISYINSYLAKTRTITGDFPVYGINESYRCKQPAAAISPPSDSYLLDEGIFVYLLDAESTEYDQNTIYADVGDSEYEISI